MILDRTHRTWAILSAIFMVAATAGYLAYVWSSPNGPQGGSVVGLLFGILSAGMMVLAGLLAVQRRLLLFPLGTRQAWLRAHIWLGLLCVPMALFHTGFQIGGSIETWLWLLTAVVVGSGIWGLILQHVLPRYLMLRVPEETFVEQIPHRLKARKVECDLAVSQAVGPLSLPDAPRLKKFLEADHIFQQPAPSADPPPAKGRDEVRLPITRTEEYLSTIATWPKDIRPLEFALGVRGRRQIVAMLGSLGRDLTVIVQVGLERRKLIKTDIWKKLPEFIESLYGVPGTAVPDTVPHAVPAQAKAEPPLTSTATAETVPPATKPLSKADQIRHAQMAKLHSADAASVKAVSKVEEPKSQAAGPPGDKPLSKVEQIRQAQLSRVKTGEPSVSEVAPGEPSTARPLSKVEMIRQAQLAKSKGAGSPQESEAPAPAAEPAQETPLSKVEQIRQQQLAKQQAKADAPEVAAAPEKPLSKLELARLQAQKRSREVADGSEAG